MRTAVIAAIIVCFCTLGAVDIADGRGSTGMSSLLLAVVNALLLS
jgi:hypothetical protein